MNWQEGVPPPKDGHEILVAVNNGCSWEYYTVWWQNYDPIYPWAMNGQAFLTEDGFDCWTEIEEPYQIV